MNFKDYYETHKDYFKKKRKERYEKHKQEEYEKRKAWQKLNQDKVKAQRRRYYEKHKKDISVKTKLYREGNKERIKEFSRLYYQNNKDILSEKSKVYYDRVVRYRHNRTKRGTQEYYKKLKHSYPQRTAYDYCIIKYGKDNVVGNDWSVLGNMEIDISIPSLKQAIEINGVHWHKERSNTDKRKIDSLISRGWKVLVLEDFGGGSKGHREKTIKSRIFEILSNYKWDSDMKRETIY